MYELLNKVIENKEKIIELTDDQRDQSISDMIDNNPELLEPFEEDDNKWSRYTDEDEYYFIKLILDGEEFISTDPYQKDEIKFLQLGDIFDDQIDDLPEEFIPDMEEIVDDYDFHYEGVYLVIYMD